MSITTFNAVFQIYINQISKRTTINLDMFKCQRDHAVSIEKAVLQATSKRTEKFNMDTVKIGRKLAKTLKQESEKYL